MDSASFPGKFTRFCEAIAKSLYIRRLGLRLAISYAAVLFLFILLIIIALGEIRSNVKFNHQFARNDVPRLLEVQELGITTEGASNALLHLLTTDRTQREAEYRVIDEKNRQISSVIGKLSEKLTEPNQAQTLKNLAQCRNQYHNAYIAMVDQLEDEGQAAAQQSFSLEVRPLLVAMQTQSNTLLQQERSRMLSTLDKAEHDFDQALHIVAVLSVLAFGLAAFLAWITARSIIMPLEKLERSALAITLGDFETRIEPSKTEEIGRVGHTLNSLSSAIAAREREIEYKIYFDSLTRLPNRNLLLKLFGQAAFTKLGIVLMDVARLNLVNETLGFDTGDNIISVLAMRINQVLSDQLSIRVLKHEASDHPALHEFTSDSFQEYSAQTLSAPPGILVRLPGGTFALLTCIENQAELEHLMQQIEQVLLQTVNCSMHAVDVSLVYGLAWCDASTMSVVALLRNAEVALSTAKRSKLPYAWYANAQEASRLSHLSLLSDLRAASREAQLQMWLQPKIKLSDQSLYGFEALVRWQHPVRGFIAPFEFIPFAENAGYISMVTNWMLECAIQTLAQWKTTYPELSIAVNLSTHDLRQADFPGQVKAMLQQYQVSPESLKLEVTESGIMQDPHTAIAALQSLKDIGIALSIDDFGTGYSSLSYLQKLPVSELKIDRSFVTNINTLPATQVLVKTIIELGHGMDLHVIAEGIETQEELDMLTALGCDAMQGYFISPPLHGKKLNDWLEKYTEK